MLYIIEVPHHKPARCWTAADKDAFVAAVAEANPSEVTLEKATPRQLLLQYGVDTVDEARTAEPWIAKLADTHGLDTALYRVNDDEFQSEQITPFEAHKKHLASTLEKLIILDGLSEAMWALSLPEQHNMSRGDAAYKALALCKKKGLPQGLDLEIRSAYRTPEQQAALLAAGTPAGSLHASGARFEDQARNAFQTVFYRPHDPSR